MQIKRRVKRIELAILIGVVIAIASTLIWDFVKFADASESLQHKVLRLHIVADSDAFDDQVLKIKVRDAVLGECGAMFYNTQTLEQTKQTAQANLYRIEQVAKAALVQNGCYDAVEAKLVNMFFDNRVYEDIAMPAGHYDAVRITIGNGNGHNWWCVLYPAVCVPAAQPDYTKDQALRDALNAAELQVVEQNPKYEVKFALWELIQKWMT